MNLFSKLKKLDSESKHVKIGLIGAGKFATMYLAQIKKTPGIKLVAIADIQPDIAKENLKRVDWSEEEFSCSSIEEAIKNNKTFITEDYRKLIDHDDIQIIVEATGNPIVAVEHAIASFESNKHVVMVTVEADAFCGPLLAKKAHEKNVIYSLAYGDQPALICDLVDWARTSGFKVTSAGRGHKWLPHFKYSTPETVWGYYGLTDDVAKKGGLNPKMFNSFLDGSKPAIESVAVCNATGLHAPKGGLTFPSGSIDDIPSLMKPKSFGGVLDSEGLVEVVSSLDQVTQKPINYDIRFGVWVVFEGDIEYIKRCFHEYGVKTDDTGKYACLYKRWHLIGLEVGISVASIATRHESTGCPYVFNADVSAVAKKNLTQGEVLDGEGGYTVVGTLVQAKDSISNKYLPLGLAHGWKLKRNINKDQFITWDDIEFDSSNIAVRARKEMEVTFS